MGPNNFARDEYLEAKMNSFKSHFESPDEQLKESEAHGNHTHGTLLGHAHVLVKDTRLVKKAREADILQLNIAQQYHVPIVMSPRRDVGRYMEERGPPIESLPKLGGISDNHDYVIVL